MGKPQQVHVKNTGRCRELLVPGAAVFVEDFSENMRDRKLRYSLIGVEKNEDGMRRLVNMDSQAPNRVVQEALEEGKFVPADLENAAVIKSEYRYGNSRLDFYAEDSTGEKALIEVKGVTLEQQGTALFPDAPTERGVRHIEELIRAKREGYGASILFVIQMKDVGLFRPNYITQPLFGHKLMEAECAGVEILAYDCMVSIDSLRLHRRVAVRLEDI